MDAISGSSAAGSDELDPEAENPIRGCHHVLERGPPVIRHVAHEARAGLAEPDIIMGEHPADVQRHVQGIRGGRNVDVRPSDQILVLAAFHQVVELLLERQRSACGVLGR